ncbi:unnamed protein product, partial [marine sediment metagenome]
MKLVENSIYLILLLLPTYLVRFEIFGIPFTLLEILIIAAFVLFLVEYKNKIVLGWWKWPLAVFLGAGLLSSIFSPDVISALGFLKAYIIEPALLFIMIINIRPSFKKMVYSLALSSLFISVIDLFQYISGYGIPAPWNIRGPEFRITSVYDYPNAVGLFLAPISVLMIGYIYT